MNSVRTTNAQTTFAKSIDTHNFEIANPASINWDDLGFGLIQTAYIGGTVSKNGDPYEPFCVIPNGNIRLSLGVSSLNYGQSIFEGLKARFGKDGKVRVFRIYDNAIRMQKGAKRMVMTPVPSDLFAKAVIEVVKANMDYVPPYGKGSLYIRPLLFGSGAQLGVFPSLENTFCVYVSPVGNYFKGLNCIRILVTTEYQRAAEKGVGHVKTAGNYGASLFPGKLAKSNGYAEMLYLNFDGQYVEEVGAANLGMVKGNELILADSGSILEGITRDSVAKLAKTKFNMKVSFEPLPIDRVLGINQYESAGPADEVFCMGTAAVISPIGCLNYQDKEYVINQQQVGDKTKQLYDLLNGIQTGEIEDEFGWTMVVQ